MNRLTCNVSHKAVAEWVNIDEKVLSCSLFRPTCTFIGSFGGSRAANKRKGYDVCVRRVMHTTTLRQGNKPRPLPVLIRLRLADTLASTRISRHLHMLIDPRHFDEGGSEE